MQIRTGLRALSGLLLAVASLAFIGRCLAADAPDAGKLEAAVNYVNRFLKEDANPASGGGKRDASAPPASDYPVFDCDVTTIVRAIRQMGTPEFEDASHRIVKVPVVAEVVFFHDAGTGGGAAESERGEGSNWCAFEYERYNFSTGTFERLPHFREKTFNQSLPDWGESHDRWMRPTKILPHDQRTRSIAVSPESRYARFVMRINVAGPVPYRTWPQVPRHLYARDALVRFDEVVRDYSQRLVFRKPDLAPDATGPALDAQMERIRGQLEDYRWFCEKIRTGLFAIHEIKPFSDIEH